jgi:hypothetical protein
MWNATFGKIESLKYPARLEKALQTLQSSVELSAPSLIDRVDNLVRSSSICGIHQANTPQDGSLSFDDSDSSAADMEPEQHLPHISKSPFRISKSAQKSRSPGNKNGRRVPSRQTPKHRLRHDDSQIEFEPILSSPSARFNQESQVLTERQKEMLERQRTEARIFSDTVCHSPSQPPGLSPKRLLEVQPDSPSGDDLPTNISRTPLKTLANMGPMDAYLGSSPTPQARNRGQQILSDESSVRTPNAVRTVQIADDLDELGSSPPQFKRTAAIAELAVHNDLSKNAENPVVGNKGLDTSYSISFDDGNTVDDELMPTAALRETTPSQDEFPTELDLTEVPSSTIELQLNAQLVADLNARSGSSDAEKPNMQPSTQAAGRSGTQPADTSRIGDSFVDTPASQEQGEVTPGAKRTRRSLRLSGPSSPAQPSVTKKRGRPRKNATRTIKKSKNEEVKTEPFQNEDFTPEDDCIVLATASSGTSRRKKTSRSQSETPSESQSLVLESIRIQNSRKRSRRPSTSLLRVSEVRTEEEILVEDTPAPKRARRTTSQDVSEANVPLPQVKRLSHVQVSPRHVATRASSVAPDENSMSVAGAPVQLDQVSSVGEQKANAAPQLRGDTASSRKTGSAHSQQASADVGMSSRTLAERVILTPKSIMERLKRTISDLKQMMLGREEERALDDVMFDLRKEVHAAGRRGQENEAD